MPTWGDILKEVFPPNSPPRFDEVRRKYLVELHRHTGRAVVLYATRWTQPGVGIHPELISITDEDLQGLMTVFHGVQEEEVDLILHSPGGSVEAAEGFVTYLRSKFKHVRAIVPQQAMSAATMVCCAAERVVLGKHSFLGPIDPQFILNTPMGQRAVTAQNILDQFEKAQDECSDPGKLGAWLPMLSQFGPDLLVKCEHANQLSRKLVQGWLESFMFAEEPNRRLLARRVAKWLSDHRQFQTHGRHLPRTELEKKGLVVDYLERDEKLQDLALSAFHATTHSMNDLNGVVKIIENHQGRAFIKRNQVLAMPKPAPQPVKPGVKPAGSPA